MHLTTITSSSFEPICFQRAVATSMSKYLSLRPPLSKTKVMSVTINKNVYKELNYTSS